MQNKPNFQKSQMNINSLLTIDYENISDWTLGENKPNSNPNKPNLPDAQMSVNSILTKDYRKKDDFLVRINKPNFRNGQNERKLNFNNGLHKKRFFRSPKTNPIQTQSNPIKPCPERSRMGQFLWIPAGVYPAQSLPRTEFTPHGVYPALRCGDAGMRGCGDAGQE
jgi:hypothetical protein